MPGVVVLNEMKPGFSVHHVSTEVGRNDTRALRA